MEWISVEDKLPEPDEYYLVAWYAEIPDMMVVGEAWYDGPTGFILPIYSEEKDAGTLNDMPKPTHWMPMPEPPEIK